MTDATDEPAGRNPGEVTMLARARVLAMQALDAMPEAEKARIDVDDFSTLSDEQTLAIGFATIGSEWLAARICVDELAGHDVNDNRTMSCGWCLRAAGNTLRARLDSKMYTFAEVTEHTLTCEHNPLVVENAKLKKQLRDAAPVMLSAMALAADEADIEGVREIVVDYEKREPRHLELWLDHWHDAIKESP